VPDWVERDDFQFTVQPGGTDTVWVKTTYNFPNGTFDGLTYTATYGVVAWHVNPPFGEYVAANVTVAWTVISSWSGSVCSGCGRVFDAETSEPISGAYVGFNIPGQFGQGAEEPAVTQADGSYSVDREFVGVPSTAIVIARGYQTYVNADYYVAPYPQQPVQQDFELIPSGTVGNYSLEWSSTLLSPIYGGAISSDFKTVVLAGGEHMTASYHASVSPSFNNSYYIYMFDVNGTMLWRFGPVSNSSDPNDSADTYGGFWGAAVTGDGSLAAVGTTNGELFVFDRHGFLWGVNATGPNGAAAFANFSPDGKYLVDTAFRATVEYRNASTGTILWTARTDEYADPRATLFSADGSKLLVGTSALRMFDTADGSLLWTRVTSGFIWPTAIAATPDFSFIVVGTGKGGSIFAYDGEGNLKWMFDATGPSITWVSMSTDGSVIATGARDGVRVFNSDGRLLWGVYGFLTRLPWLGDVTAGAVTPDGRYVLIGTLGNTIYLDIAVPNGALLFDRNGTLLWSDFWNSTATKWSPLEFGKPTFAATSSDGSTFVFGSTDNMVRVYRGSVVASTSASENFTLGVSDNSISVFQNDSSSLELQVGSQSAQSYQVTLSADGLPSGVSATLAPQSGSPPFNSSLTLSATSEAVPGNYTISVAGTGNNVTVHTSPITLTVLANQTNAVQLSFSMQSSSNSVSIYPGNSTTVQLNLNVNESVAYTVSLSASGLPNGVEATFNTSSAVPPFSCVLTISTISSVTPGTYSITINAEGGGYNCTSALNLSVLQAVPSTSSGGSSPDWLWYEVTIVAVVAVMAAGVVLFLKSRKPVHVQ
jgi:hypothetical protein